MRIHLTDHPVNNIVERLNGTLRERQKVTRGLKKPDGPLPRGHAAYYNLIRPTPASRAAHQPQPPGCAPRTASGSRWGDHPRGTDFTKRIVITPQ